MRYQFLQSCAILLTGCFIAAAQPASEIGYIVPLYNVNDRTGKSVAQIIDVELTKMAMDNKLGSLRKLTYSIDTSFRRLYQQDSIARIDGGFFEPAAVCRRLYGPNLIPTKLMIVYDVTAHHEFDRWKAWVDPSNYVPGVMSGGIILESIAAGTPNEFDSLWCKVSLIDCNNMSQSIHAAIAVNEETCDGKPVECIVETLQKIGRNPDAQLNKPSLKLVSSPKDQHWGKIIGGSALITGGFFGFFVSSFMKPDARPTGFLISGSMVGAGSAFLTIGIIRQKRYFDVH